MRVQLSAHAMPAHHFSFGPDIGYTVGNMLVAQLDSEGKGGACAVPHYRCRDTSLMVVAPSREDGLRDLVNACDEIVRLLNDILCDQKKCKYKGKVHNATQRAQVS